MRRQLLPLTLALSALLATVASAADWRQFRHDGYRTGRSEDKVPGPLTDIWTWEASGLYESSRPFGTVAVWKDRLFTFSNENSAPHLVCVDARTGNRRWTRALNLGRGAAVARQDAGPAVTPEGAVYAYGTQPFSSPVQHRLMRDA